MINETRQYLEGMLQHEANEFDKDLKDVSLNSSRLLKAGYEREYALIVAKRIQNHIAVIEALKAELKK